MEMKLKISTVLLGIVLTQVHAARLQDNIKPCLIETSASAEVAAKVLNFDYSFSDAKGKCFLKCACTKSGYCDAEGKIIGSEILKYKPYLAATEVNAALVECNALSKDDACETVFTRHTCLASKVPNLEGFARNTPIEEKFNNPKDFDLSETEGWI